MPAANAAAPVAGPADKGIVDRSHKGEAAPDLAFFDSAGKKASLAAFKGKPVLLNLWATWCAPCKAEMPTLDAMAGQKGGALQVIALSQDSAKARPEVDAYIAEKGFRHLQFRLDPDTAFSLSMNTNLPTTILYDSAGKEIWRVAGDMDWTGTKAAALLAEAT